MGGIDEMLTVIVKMPVAQAAGDIIRDVVEEYRTMPANDPRKAMFDYLAFASVVGTVVKL